MSLNDEALFRTHSLVDMLDAHLRQVADKVDAIPEQQFLATDDEAIVNYLVSDLEVQRIELHVEAAQMTQAESKVEVVPWRRRGSYEAGESVFVPGQLVAVSIPFDGDPTLWKLRPSTWRGSFPRGLIRRGRGELGGVLEIMMGLPDEVPEERFKEHLDKTLDDIAFCLENQKTNIDRANADLPNHIRQAIQARRARLEKHGRVRKLLNIPLAKKPGAPDLEQIPIRRKLIKPLPPVPNVPPEPGIRQEDYEHILSVIRHEGRSFEATPKTFAVHDEEELRDIILAHLNGHYRGEAAGEAFRRLGKTDIRIEAENRAAFVAECKVWRGPKEMLAAIDQLQGYLTWRDCRAALVIFNKDVAGFAGIQDKLAMELQGHPLFLSSTPIPEAGEWRFRFRAKDDADRQITVHVFLFNLFVGN